MKASLTSLFFFILTFLQINAADLKEAYQKIDDKNTLQIQNPYLQNRQIKKLRLNNGLKVLIISDKNADQSAAALGVMVGHWEDPDNYPGMAHFCEHMLFKGSTKYPDEAEYFRFMWDHGGTPNAFTAHDRTVYMFSINNDYFAEGLDRLSYFFISPSFNTDDVARELFAVDQEHSKNIEADNWRRYMITKEIGNQRHPNKKFSTGNSKTLGGIPPQALQDWWEKHYSANLMTLVIYSPLSTEELTQMAVEKFSKIQNKGRDAFQTDEKLFSQNTLGKIVYIKPIRNLQTLSLEFELDKSFAKDTTKSVELISYAINRGQKSSLLENLKKENLAENLKAETEKLGTEHIIFTIEVELTDKGLQNKDTIIQRCFEAINNLKQSNIPFYLFQEMNSMAKLNYEYQVHEEAFAFIIDQTTKLMDEDISTYPQYTTLASQYDPQKIQQALSEINYQNCMFYIQANPQKTKIYPNKKEKWMQAEYTIQDLSKNLVKNLEDTPLNSNIKIPDPNPFIPTNLQIIQTQKTDPTFADPKKIVSNDFANIYYAKDNIYKVPEIAMHFSIKDPIFTKDAKAVVLKDLYTKALLENLEPMLNAAEDAGLSANIFSKTYSFDFAISGYSEKAYLLIEETLKTIKTLDVPSDKFNLYKNYLLKTYENHQKMLPLYQANEYMSYYLTPSNLLAKQKYNALKKISYSDFQAFKNEIFTKIFLESFISGNITIKEAESIFLDIKDTIGKSPFYKNEIPQKEILSMSTGPFMIQKNSSIKGTGAVLVIEQGDYSFKNRAAQNIIGSALREAFFTELRSHQKTAYMAHASDLEKEKTLFQYFGVQSNSHSPKDLISRFEIFLENYIQDLEINIPENRFETIKKNIITLLQTPPKNLNEMTDRLYTFAFEYNEDFELINKRINSLNDLTYQEFLVFANDTLSKTNKKRLALLFEGEIANTKKLTYQEVTSDEFLKQNQYVAK